VSLLGQQIQLSPDTIKQIDNRLIIENAGSRIIEIQDSSRIQYLYDKVRAYHDSTYFYADTAILTESYMIAYGGVIIIQKDTIQLFGDSLYFNRDSSLAEIYGDVVLKNGDQTLSGNSLFYRTQEKIAYYTDTALLEHNSMKLQSIMGTFLIEKKVGYFEKDVIMISKDVRLRSSRLTYFTEETKAEFTSPTRIKTLDAEIYCEDGYYNTELEQGVFRRNAQYKGKDRSVTGEEIQYDKVLDQVKVVGDARFSSDSGKGVAEEMEYNELSQDLVLIGHAELRDSSSLIKGERVTFNQESGDLFIAGNGFLLQEEWQLEATNIEYNDNTGLGMADGDVIWIDTTSKSTLFCDIAEFNRNNNYLKAFNYDSRPYMELRTEQDTMYLSADTIRSFELIDTMYADPVTLMAPDSLHSDYDSTLMTLPPDTLMPHTDPEIIIPLDSNTVLKDSLPGVLTPMDSLEIPPQDTLVEEVYVRDLKDATFIRSRVLVADNDARIYRKDMQAICDSLTYNLKDSVIILMSDPVLWSDTTQFTGDTISLFQKNGKLNKMVINNRVMILNSQNPPFFNQIKGKNLTGYFVENELDYFNVVGSAQSLYYMMDDDGAFIAVNKTECSSLKFFFENNEISDIRGYIDVKSKLIPMDKADHGALKLEGFKWRASERPLSVDDVTKRNK
jgi:lipopolysaccharide export system protein LptA